MFKNKNILFLTQSYKSFQKDQIEELAKYFKRVYVLVRYKPIAEIGNFFGLSEARLHKKTSAIDLTDKPKNVEIIPVSLWYFPFDWFYRKLGDWHFRSVDKIIREKNIKFDLIHAHFTWSSGYVGMKLKEKYLKPLIITGHGYDVYQLPFKNEFWKEKITDVLNSANQIITVSQSNLRYLNKLQIKVPISVIPNGFNQGLFFKKDKIKSRRELGLVLKGKIILNIGNLTDVKGQKYLIEAVNRLKKKYKDIFCLIIGEGPLRNRLQNQINKHRLQKNVQLLGIKPHHQLNKWINASDILVVPSLSESFGVVQLEAMACGKPVVATRNGGSQEIIISSDYGLLCQKKKPKDLTNKIGKALNRKWNSDKINVYSNQFSWNKIVSKIMSIYEKVL